MTTPSPTTLASDAFVAGHKDLARRLGEGLAEHSHDPEAFATALRAAFGALADPSYLAGQQFVAPGIGPIHGVRWPLLTALAQGFRQATRRDDAGPLLYVVERLLREPRLEARWFALGLAERMLQSETERTWQLLRRAAREAGDWITVDSLARPYAAGIAAEAYRWAELELLVYSPSRWERRLIGSTIATLSHGPRGRRLAGEIVDHGLPILAQLMGDAEPDVQKALSWAYRSLAALDQPATAAALRSEAATAVRDADGHRAWVIRDARSKLTPADAEALRRTLAGVRKRAGTPSTSPAALTAARFGRLPDPSIHPEPPLA